MKTYIIVAVALALVSLVFIGLGIETAGGRSGLCVAVFMLIIATIKTSNKD